MTSQSDCVAIIPAKGTSQRIPRKNVQLCAGTSLVQRAVDCAEASAIFRDIWVSTEEAGIWWSLSGPTHLHLRDPRLSAEGVSVAAVVAAWLGSLGVGEYAESMPESFCVLWPTSPLRTPEILRAAFHAFVAGHHEALHTVCSGGATHDGTALFMRTRHFLSLLTLDLAHEDMMSERFEVPAELSLDVNTPEDLAEAERRLLAREAQCPSN